MQIHPVDDYIFRCCFPWLLIMSENITGLIFLSELLMFSGNDPLALIGTDNFDKEEGNEKEREETRLLDQLATISKSGDDTVSTNL